MRKNPVRGYYGDTKGADAALDAIAALLAGGAEAMAGSAARRAEIA